MKNFTKLLFVIILTSVSFIYAQESQQSPPSKNIRINLYGAYTFEDSFESYYDYGYYYQGQLQDGTQYGIGIEMEVKPSSFVELLWLSEKTTANAAYYGGGLFDQYADFDVDLDYIMLGFNRSFRKPGSNVEGFGGLMLGVGVVNIDGQSSTVNYSDSITKFAWGLKGGATIWASERIGIKLQGQLLSISQSVGGGVYFGTGGAGVGVSSYSSLYQFTLGGGLVFALGQ